MKSIKVKCGVLSFDCHGCTSIAGDLSVNLRTMLLRVFVYKNCFAVSQPFPEDDMPTQPRVPILEKNRLQNYLLSLSLSVSSNMNMLAIVG